MVDKGVVAPVRDTGARVLAPGLVYIDDAVHCGDEVFILSKDGTCVGARRSRVDAVTARTLKRGGIIRTRRNVPSSTIPGRATWGDAVRANEDVLNRAESAAVKFVQEVAGPTTLPKNVSYSDGKDSLATLLVVFKAVGTTPLLFADTGMEFPETCANVDAVSQHYNAEVVRTSTQNQFWEMVEHDGPPAVNARWCCKTGKLDPDQHLILSRRGECLSFIGQRRYESISRAKRKRIWKNPNVRAQLCAAPIHNWTALHVWLYLMRKLAPNNTLYEHRLDRIGCFMCPSSDMALIRMIEKDYPSLWRGWCQHPEVWQESHGLQKEWVWEGHWRHLEVRKNEENQNC